MKAAAVIWGGVLGGVVAALMLATIGGALGFTIPPWNWSSFDAGFAQRAAEWAWTAAVLAPAGAVLGIAGAFVCAIVFEYVTARAGWWRGAIIGLFLGVAAASVAGLMPWVLSWYGFAYMPVVAPFGPSDPSWPLVALVAAGVIVGLVAGACYGSPVHAMTSRAVPRWRQIYP